MASEDSCHVSSSGTNDLERTPSKEKEILQDELEIEDPEDKKHILLLLSPIHTKNTSEELNGNVDLKEEPLVEKELESVEESEGSKDAATDQTGTSDCNNVSEVQTVERAKPIERDSIDIELTSIASEVLEELKLSETDTDGDVLKVPNLSIANPTDGSNDADIKSNSKEFIEVADGSTQPTKVEESLTDTQEIKEQPNKDQTSTEKAPVLTKEFLNHTDESSIDVIQVTDKALNPTNDIQGNTDKSTAEQTQINSKKDTSEEFTEEMQSQSEKENSQMNTGETQAKPDTDTEVNTDEIQANSEKDTEVNKDETQANSEKDTEVNTGNIQVNSEKDTEVNTNETQAKPDTDTEVNTDQIQANSEKNTEVNKDETQANSEKDTEVNINETQANSEKDTEVNIDEIQENSNRDNTGEDQAPMILQLYDDEKGVTCEIKTENLNMLEVEKLSKELCGTEFIVDLGPSESLGAEEPPCVRPNALAPVECEQLEPKEINDSKITISDAKPTEKDIQSPPKKRAAAKKSKALDKSTTDDFEVKAKKRTSLPNLKSAAKRKLGGTPRKLVGGARKMVPAKRAKSLGNTTTKSPATPKAKTFRSQPSSAWDADTLKIPLLQHGWFRELVHRKTSTPKKREGDIYYFSPEPNRKKYRSRNEIERMLPKNSPLRANHFSFSKQLLGLGPEYERERDAAVPGMGKYSVAKLVKKTSAKNTPAKSKISSPSAKYSPVGTPGSKRGRRKSAKLLAQEETDKENETDVVSPKVEANGRKSKTPAREVEKVSVKSGKKRSLGADANTPSQKKAHVKVTPMRRKSKAKETTDPETTPELLDDDLSAGKNDKFPRIKLKISNGQTPTSGKSEKRRSSVVLKEKNNATPTSSNERKSGRSSVKKIRTEMGPASKTKRAPVILEVEKKSNDSKKKSTDYVSKEKKSLNTSSSEVKSGRKVPPISLSIIKSPQKTIVSIKKSADGKRPEIQVEIRKPAMKADESRTSEAKKAEVSDHSDDGTSGDKNFDPMRTRKRAGFTLSKEECDIISGAKRAKISPGKPTTPPNISKEEAARLSSVKVCLNLVPEGTSAKKRKPAKTLEAEFDKIDRELHSKRKRQEKEVKSDSPSDKKQSTGRAKSSEPPSRQSIGRGKSSEPLSKLKEKNVKKENDKTDLKAKTVVRTVDSKKKSMEKKENVIVNGIVKENKQGSKRVTNSSSSSSHNLPLMSETAAFKIASLFSDPGQNNPLHQPLVHMLSYLTVQDRLRAARVNKLFHLAAQHQSLWTHIRLKNSRVQDWRGLASAFSKHKTQSLDMKKMLTPSDPDAQLALWSGLPAHLGRIEGLRSLDLGKCVSAVFENLCAHLSRLETLNATLHRGQSVVLSHFTSMTSLTKLRLKGFEIKKGAQNIFSLNSLSQLTHLKHLALTSVGNLNQASLDTITTSCPNLTALELGSCAGLTGPGVAAHLARLRFLEKLRLEIVPKEASVLIVESVAKLPSLYHLELINVDVPRGFDDALGLCTRLRTLIIIPTYVSQSALTNYLLLSGFAKLHNTLRLLSWGLTVELLQVTNMFAAKWKGASQFKPDGTCIPVMSPIPACYLDAEETAAARDKALEVDLFRISRLKQLLTGHMRTSGVSIITMNYSNTLRHTMMK